MQQVHIDPPAVDRSSDRTRIYTDAGKSRADHCTESRTTCTQMMLIFALIVGAQANTDWREYASRVQSKMIQKCPAIGYVHEQPVAIMCETLNP